MLNGHFVISLDFELYWGVHDVFSVRQYGDNIRNVNYVIPRLISLFERYEIRATFAIVGGIYHTDFEDFRTFISDSPIFPEYHEPILSPYSQKGLQKIANMPELFFQKQLIDQIKIAGHEIGTHTYCHYYCDEEGADVKSFEYDIKNAVGIAEKYGDNITSIVFPRNQIPPQEFEDILLRYGITCCRSNPYVGYSSNNLLNKVRRTIMSYFPLQPLTSNVPEKNDIIKIQANYFLRPYSKYNFLNKQQMRYIKKSLE